MFSNRCHHWNAHAQDYGYQIPNFEQYCSALVDPIEKQDIEMLEAIQLTIEQDRRGYMVPEVSVRADRAAIEARRLLQQMLKAESVSAASLNALSQKHRREHS
jgi:hypothetical protein